MKKICPLCGTENEENARFCKECKKRDGGSGLEI